MITKKYVLHCQKELEEVQIPHDSRYELMHKAYPWLKKEYTCHILDTHTGEQSELGLKDSSCKDCGRATPPGVSSARCPECWEDRCGK